jgi:WbqC-like protein family
MIVAIMQPYFFPYIGYFQLMQAVDMFVLYDDVQYMKGGWINRNLIRLNDDLATWLTIPICHASTYLNINERTYKLDKEDVEHVENKLKASYARAPAYAEVMDIINHNLHLSDPNVATVNTRLLKAAAERIGITCQLVRSSEIGVTKELHGEDRVIAICKALRATQYINAIGGVGLYSAKRFSTEGLLLSFLRTLVPPEPLRDGPTHLSILDMLFQEPTERISDRLDRYELVSA